MSKKNFILRFVAALALMVCMAVSAASAQRNNEEPETLFWIAVKVNKTIDRNTRLEEYQLRLISPTIYHGSVKMFQKALWTGMAQGSKLCVGPFQSHEEAKHAMLTYKGVNSASFLPQNDKHGYWFLVKVGIMERSRSYAFEHMAAQVNGGKTKEFLDVLRESLNFKTVAIGPFDSDIQAERAKSIYRIEE